MNRYKLAILLSCVAGVATVATAKPVVQATPGLKAGISKTVTETWQLSEDEKKNTAKNMMMSSLTAVAIAPSGKVQRKNWTALNSQHKACFYNTYGTAVAGKYAIKMNIAGQEVNAFDSVVVAGGQAFCVTRYLEMWLNAQNAGQVATVANTHVEMDGQSTDNEGHGSIEVR